MNNIIESLKLEALNLNIGDSTQIVCLFCNATHESSLSITKIQEGLLYHCFRASCNASGFIPSFQVPYDGEKKKEFQPKYFHRPLTKLPIKYKLLLKDKYGITNEEIKDNGFAYDFLENRLYMPIYNRNGFIIGAAAKTLSDHKQPKVIVYWFNDAPKLHYVQHSVHYTDGFIVLVEDILSAVKLSRYIPTVALLGTNLSYAMVEDLKQGINKIILALDPDAVDKALRYKEKYSLYFKEIVVVHLSKDPKDLSEEEIKEKILL